MVGVTGGIGSGKTTVCKIFELLGIPVFYADEEAKQLYKDPKIRAKVIQLFGEQILNVDQEIDKAKLGQLVFSNKSWLAKLNALIHPAVRTKFKAWKKVQKGKKYVIEEAAIMIESGAYKEIDYLISIKSPKALRIKRLINRNNTTPEEVKKRMKEQISDAKRDKYSDAVIMNDDKHSLIEQVLNLHKRLSAK